MGTADDDGTPCYFGRCPECRSAPIHVAVENGPDMLRLTNYMVCHDCKVMWMVGQNLLSGPDDPPQTLAEAGIATYRIIDCTEAWDGPKLNVLD